MGYSLDGQENATITGNTTIIGLQSGSHSLAVYVRDAEGKIMGSETVAFIVKPVEGQSQQPFPTMTIAAVAISVTGVSFACVAVAWKRKKSQS